MPNRTWEKHPNQIPMGELSQQDHHYQADDFVPTIHDIQSLLLKTIGGW